MLHADALALGTPIVQVIRRPCPYASSFQIDEVDVHLEGGAVLALVVKHLGHHGMMPSARRVRPAFLEDPTREHAAYRLVLPHGPPGPPTHLEPLPDLLLGEADLLLERVEGEQLSHVGDFSAWTEAAAWIARFHAAFAAGAREAAAQCRALGHDAAFYLRWADRARHFSRTDSARQRTLAHVTEHYGRVVERLVAMPRTLIHGEFYPSNVIVQESPRRICPVDWEMVGFAPGLIDLAALTAGWIPSKQQALVDAYASALATAAGGDDGVASPDFLANLDCCRLHLTMRMLGWSDTWQPPAEHAHDWLADAVALTDRLAVA
jgi:hypothetical protein